MKALEDSSDAEIMRRVQAGDDHGFGEIVRRYQAALRRVAFSRLGQSDLAEEAVQETFLAAYKARHTYNGDFAFRTWLWTILLNKCKLLYGKRLRHPETTSWSPRNDEDAQPVCRAAEPASEMQAREEAALLEKLLPQLPVTQADALRLRFFGGLSFPEIARTMRCSLGTAKNRVKKGLATLSEWIREHEAGIEPHADARRLKGERTDPNARLSE